MAAMDLVGTWSGAALVTLLVMQDSLPIKLAAVVAVG